MAKSSGKSDLIDVKGRIDSLNDTLRDHLALLDKNADSVAKLNNNYAKLPSEYLRQQETAKTNNEKIATSQSKVQKASLDTVDALLKEIDALKKKDTAQAAVAKNNAQATVDARILRTESQRLAVINSELSNEYEKLNAKMNLQIRTAQGLAIQMYNLEQAGAKGSAEWHELAASLDMVQKEVQQTDGALKAVDASLGRNQRNVGNYKSAYNGLGNAVNQITRELPAFTFSAQTGFLAISNNLPILFDEISKINVSLLEIRDAAAAANVELVKQTEIQLAAAVAAEQQSAALLSQVESITINTDATAEQTTAIRAAIQAQLVEIRTTGIVSEATLANTEALLLNIGATEEQIVAIRAQVASTELAAKASASATASLQAQAAATAEANAVSAATPGIMSRIGSSIFSLNGLLVAGTLILTLYGKEIVEWAEGLFGADEILKQLNENQIKFNKSRTEGLKTAIAPIDELQKYLRIAKDVTLSDEKRAIAIERIRSLYVGYTKDIKDQQFLDGKTAVLQDRITRALNNKADAEAKVKIVQENEKKIKDLERELKLQEDIVSTSRANLEKLNNISGINPNIPAKAARDLVNEESKIPEIKEKIARINKQNLYYEEQIYKLQAASILLEDKKDPKGKTERIKLTREETQANKDYAASEFEIIRMQLENQIKYKTLIKDSESESIADRKNAALELTKYRNELAELEYKEQIRVNDFKLADSLRILQAEKENALNKNQENLANTKGYVDRTAEILDDAHRKEVGMTEQAQNENLKAFVVVADKRKTIADETLKYLKGIEDKLTDSIASRGVNSGQLENIRQLSLMLKNVTSATTVDDYKKIEELRVQIATKSTEELIQIELHRVAEQIAGYDECKTSSEEYQKLLDKEIELQTKLETTTQARLDKDAAKTKELQEALQSYLDTISYGFISQQGMSSLEQFFKIGEDGLSDFERRFNSITDADPAAKFRKQFQVAFEAISEVAVQTFDILNASSEKYYERDLARAEKQYNTAILFAGDSATAKAEIDRQYEQKKIQIERRKAKADRDNAIFQAIIQGAQAVVAALPNFALAAIVGALAAAQIAAISSTPLPQYEFGTDNHPGGAMIVNDGKGSKYQEKVIKPDGSTYKPQGRNVKMHAPAGTKVLTYDQWQHEEQLNSILGNLNISPASDTMLEGLSYLANQAAKDGGSSITAEEMEEIMSRNLKKIKVNNITLDKNGFTVAMVEAHQRTIDTNNRAAAIGIET